jgi:hypothetical protein
LDFVADEVTTRRKSNKRSVRTTEKQRMLEKRKNKEDYLNVVDHVIDGKK